jgi:ATP/maltotriose-dependent transcriptional regulator MalT
MPRMAPSDPAIETHRDRHPRYEAPYLVRDPDVGRPIAVGPGRPEQSDQVMNAAHDTVTGFPIQYAKVQAPPLREETLSRDRLLDWLHLKIHSRVILVLADAGYGKTTLLADFARRTRLRTLWYRLDDDDLDWMAILHHLVAAGREHDPGFAPATLSMLGETGINGPSLEAVLDVFIRELPTIAPNGAILILDDFHLVDEAPDMRVIARELIQRAPERLSIVFASRRGPTIPLARLRANGEVAELGTDDLRFDASETARLFSETYGRTLEPDVLADVSARTEGWAASLQLVEAALRDRTPAEIRRFVRSLSGADQELYDYLAEEVVGDLPEDLQQFLMRTSILQVVTQDLAGVASGCDEADVIRLTVAAERLTLLGRRAGGPRTQLRYHPLVRGFLAARLDREIGPGTVRSLHELVGRFAEGSDWRVAAHHYSMAGDRPRAHEVIDHAAQDIVAKGEYSLTETYLTEFDDGVDRASFEVLRSRRDFKRGDVVSAVARAHRAVALDPNSSIALVNLASLAYNVGDFDVAIDLSRLLAENTRDAGMRGIAKALVALIDSSLDGNLRDLVQLLRSLADRQREAGATHFEGIAYLNLSFGLRALGDFAGMLEASATSIELLMSSSAGSEVAAAHTARAWALAHTYGIETAAEEMSVALLETNLVIRTDVLGELADIETWYGSAERAADYLAQLESMGDGASWARKQIDATRAHSAIRAGDVELAAGILDGISLETPCIATGHKARLLATRAHLLVAVGAPTATAAIEAAGRQARRQAAGLWTTYCHMLTAVSGSTQDLRRFIRLGDLDALAALSMAAEL